MVMFLILLFPKVFSNLCVIIVDKGHEYYHNAATGDSTYKRPINYNTPRQDESQEPVATGQNGWVKYWEDNGGYGKYQFEHLFTFDVVL